MYWNMYMCISDCLGFHYEALDVVEMQQHAEHDKE